MKTNYLKLSGCMTIMLSLFTGIMTAQQAFAEEGGHGCSMATLKGTYQFASSGFVRKAPLQYP